MNEKDILYVFCSLSFCLFAVGCGSGGEDVNNLFDIDGPTTPVDKDLSIAITKPTSSGTPTGHSKNTERYLWYCGRYHPN